MSSGKILIADDDRNVHESLGIYLKSEGFETVDVYDGAAAVSALDGDISLCVMDIMMPIMNGLELGADDYIVKPFSPREVVARIKAVLRRTSVQQSNDDGRVTLNGLVIDIKSYTVTLKGQPVICTPKEIEILYMLASNPGQVFTREQLLNKVWGYDFAGETRTVDTHIKRIRAKLDNTGLNWSIKTIYGVGYKFEVE